MAAELARLYKVTPRGPVLGVGARIDVAQPTYVVAHMWAAARQLGRTLNPGNMI
jgi:hypothetical protein